MKVPQRVSESETQTVGSTQGWSQFTKGHNSVKTVNVVRVLNLCTSSDVFYICTKFQEVSLRLSELLRGWALYTEIFKGAYLLQKV